MSRATICTSPGPCANGGLTGTQAGRRADANGKSPQTGRAALRFSGTRDTTFLASKVVNVPSSKISSSGGIFQVGAGAGAPLMRGLAAA